MSKKIIFLAVLVLPSATHASEYAGQVQYGCIYNYWSEPGFEAKAFENNNPAKIDYIIDARKDQVLSKRGDKYSPIDYSISTSDGGTTFIQETTDGQSFITLIGADGKSIITHNVFKNGRPAPLVLHGQCTVGISN